MQGALANSMLNKEEVQPQEAEHTTMNSGHLGYLMDEHKRLQED